MAEEQQNINIKELSSAISQLCDEKGINRDRIMEIVEDALAAAYKKDYGHKGQIIKASFDKEKQSASFYQIKEVVDETTRIMEEEEESESEEKKEEKETKMALSEAEVSSESEEETLPRFNKERDILLEDAKKIKKSAEVGDEIKIKLAPQSNFGRVAAQNAKQVIIQRIREAERETLYEEFKNKKDEVITATVQRVEGRNVYLDLGKMVGVLLPPDQVPQENYRTGQRIKVFVAGVDKDARDTTVTLSRSNPNLVTKLFALEVPEIFSGTVVIKSIAREPGSRSKIAVKSLEKGIDPIGSCVGQKGIRVQAIIDELGGEKIDIIEYNEDAKTFISHALSPAKVKYVELDEKNNQATVTVDPDQLSLAIGKRGQNVRLAARLTGWKIDVVGSEDSAKAEEGESQPKKEEKEDKKDKKIKVKKVKAKKKTAEEEPKEKKKKPPSGRASLRGKVKKAKKINKEETEDKIEEALSADEPHKADLALQEKKEGKAALRESLASREGKNEKEKENISPEE